MGMHTYAKLEISNAAYKEIKDKLKDAGYDHAFMEDGVIDMHGISLCTPYDASTENVRAHLNQKLNEAVDKIASDNGISRDELLRHARNLLERHSNDQVRAALKNEPEDKA